MEVTEVQEYLEANENVLFEIISKKAGREIKSVDELTTVEYREKEVEPQLPEDVKSYWDYTKETGRNFNDFLKVKKDWKSESKQSVVMEYMRKNDGLEGDVLNDYYNLNFVPDEEASDREKKMAKIEFERTYNKALSALTKEQEQYSIPTNLQQSQRQARQQVEDESKKWNEGLQTAFKGINSIDIDDFEYKIDPSVESNYNSLDAILSTFKDGNGQIDFAELIKTIHAGRNRTTLAKSYAQAYEEKRIKEGLLKMQNHQNPAGDPRQPATGAIDINHINSIISKL